MHAAHDFADVIHVDPFAFDREDLFWSLRAATDAARDGFATTAMVRADPMRGSGRAYVHGASRRLLDVLAKGGWAPLPRHEAVGLPDRLWFIEDPVELPADASLMLAHWTAKSYADDLELLFGRRNGDRVPDGRFFTRAVVRHAEGCLMCSPPRREPRHGGCCSSWSRETRG
jgi:hypothetical protein